MKAKIADIAKRFREEIAKCSDFDSLQTIKAVSYTHLTLPTIA